MILLLTVGMSWIYQLSVCNEAGFICQDLQMLPCVFYGRKRQTRCWTRWEKWV